MYEATSTGTVSSSLGSLTGYTSYATFNSSKCTAYNYETGKYEEGSGDYTSYYALKIETSQLTAYYVYKDEDDTYTANTEDHKVYTKM